MPEDADEIVIKDTLVNALEFAKAPANGTLTNDQTVAAEASTKPAEVVTSIVVKDSNDHTVNGTVAGSDGEALGDAAVPTIKGKTLTVNIEDATAYRGQYIQVTFWAKYTQEMIDAAEVGDSKKITGNGAVLGGKNTHTGTTNDASYDIRVGNEWTKDVKSNTVTVKSKTTKLEAEKKWQNADGSAADWPKDVEKVEINVLKGTAVVATIELTEETPKAESKELPVLVGVTYKLDEVEVPGYTTTVDGTVFTNKKQPNQPEIEKYINKDVDAHLEEFDKAFTYDIMAFVPEDADSIEITDTLVAALEFAEGPVNEKKAAVASTDKTKVVSSVVAKAENDHTANGTVKSTDGTAVTGAECEIDGQTLTVTIEDATAYRGQWIQVTFTAKYTQAAINAAKVANSEDVTDNGTVISEITEHDGTANKASYKIKVGNEWSSDYESNTVTHDAETVKVEAEKKWKNADGTDAEWPSGVKEVKVKVINDKTKKQVATITLTKAAPKAESKELPKLIGVTYSIKENPIKGYISKVNGNVVTNTEGEGPEVEKYVNNDVTYDFENFDQTFEYEIMGFITNDATEATFTDELNSVLEFVGNGNIKVYVYDKGTENDHKTTVAEAGKDVTPTSAEAKDGKLTVSFDEAAITPLRGCWVKVTFEAQISEAGYKTVAAKVAEKNKNGTAADDANWSNIDDNEPVLIEKEHDGVPNQAKLYMNTENNGEFNLDTNTVTVEPKTEQLKATKAWKNADGSAMATWPTGAKVTFALMNGDEEIETKTLSKAGTVTFTAQPKLDGVTYTVKEKSVTGIDALQDGDPTVAESTWTFTNKKQPTKPSIEKYINKDVDAHLVEFDKVFTYDILAFVPEDADKIEITDTLVNAIEFVTAEADVKVAVQATNDHKANGTVATEGTAVSDADCKIVGQTLTVTIEKAEAYRGQWIQVTFEAKYTDATIKAAEVADSKTVTDNGAVITEITEHDGTANTASYKIEVVGTWSSDYYSNTVTHDAETEKVEAEKKWQNADGTTKWPEKVAEVKIDVLNGEEVVDTIVLTSEKTKGTSKELPKLIGVTYKLAETSVPGYVTTVAGKVVTNKEEKPELEKYINQNVHEFVTLDEVFTYDIIAYVPKDADKLVITDELDAQLQFAKDGADVKVYDLGETNNHKTADKAAADGATATVATSIEDITSKATISAENGVLSVTIANDIKSIDNEKGVITYNSQDLSPYRGHYIRVEFKAQVADDIDVTKLTTVDVDDNKTLDVTDKQEEHSGIENKAKYTVEVGNEGVYKSESNVVTVIPEKPEIEKYVNKKDATSEERDGTVHTDLNAFDEVYTYDIQAYVTCDATYVVVTDQLVEVLEYVDNGTFKVVYKDGEGKDGKIAPALSKAGTELTGWSADFGTGTENMLVITFGSDADDAEVLPYAGKWIQITFDAKIKNDYKTIEALKAKGVEVWTTITENDPVEDADTTTDFSGAEAKSHEGIINETSYTINRVGAALDNKWEYSDKSNTVTVQPKTTEVTVSKEWVVGTEVQTWPNGAEVEVKVIGKDGEEVAKDTLTADKQSVTFSDLPCLEDVTYTVEEGEVTHAGQYEIGKVEEVEPGVFKITNTGKTDEPAPKTTNINITKVWDDWNNIEGKRPEEIQFTLYANGEMVEGIDPVVLTREADQVVENQWRREAAFTNLPKYDADGKEIEYTIKEEAIKFYVVEIFQTSDGFVVKNTSRPWIPELPRTPGKYGKLTVTKTVSGAAEKDKAFSFTVKITWANGEVTQSDFKIKANESYTTDYIPEDADVEIIENDANGYTVTYKVDDVLTSKFKVVGSNEHKAVVNNYKDEPKKPTPPTGDDNNMLLWAVIAAAAALLAVGVIKIRKRN